MYVPLLYCICPQKTTLPAPHIQQHTHSDSRENFFSKEKKERTKNYCARSLAHLLNAVMGIHAFRIDEKEWLVWLAGE
jgi:hypothetical protein